ncbi:MAG: ATP-binding cassette domain-containing protein [Armatimonadetes bacterium]|nr:MAG: ATP-binding cassette domain-containing protein [Armatimonadota bacterium]
MTLPKTGIIPDGCRSGFPARLVVPSNTGRYAHGYTQRGITVITTKEGSGVVASAVEIRGLRKVYSGFRARETVAIDSLDLDVPIGGVFGFLGPNGAGKTTAIRCLLGLVTPTKGSVRVLDSEVPRGLPDVINRVGALVESPKFFPGFSGRLNLELLAATRRLPASEVERVLDEVGLADRAEDHFETYSLGMKQRLAVAGAILKNPDLLVLDEPANGLDPAGIKDMRELIRRYGASGSTVLVSSHQLAEVQLMCDSVAIINRGKLITSGAVADVLAGHAARLRVAIDDVSGASLVLESAGFVVQPAEVPGQLIVEAGESDAARVTETLAVSGRYLRGLRVETANLESVFLELTTRGDT